MNYNKKTVQDIDVAGKKVLLRCDFNVPMAKDGSGVITDDKRIRAALPTIQYLLDHNAAVIACSHMGKPNPTFETYVKKQTEKGKDPATLTEEKWKKSLAELSLKPVAARLSELLGREVIMAADVVGPDAQSKAAALQPGQILLLENTRFEKGETKNDPALAKAMASLAEVYVSDAFGAVHRAHASTAGVADYLPAVSGFLIQKELEVIGGALANPKRPLVAILGGSKVSSKIGVINNLLEIADTIIIGGGMAYTFSAAQGGKIGGSLLEADWMDYSLEMLQKAKDKGVKLLLPVDTVCADKFAPDANSQVVKAGEIPDGWKGLDIGPETVKLYCSAVADAGTVIWNGPMGVFEFPAFAKGTEAVAEALSKTDAITIIGGGDSAAAVQQLGYADKMTHISTGGGSNAYVAGYRIGGKSGTSEQLNMERRADGDYKKVASFAAVLPANDPEILVYVMLDDPNNAHTDYSSILAAPVVGNIISEIAPYLGIATDGIDRSQNTVKVPNLVGKEWSNAQVSLNTKGLKHQLVESESDQTAAVVTYQYPHAGAAVASGTTIYLYTDTYSGSHTEVPDVSGKSADFARQMLTAAGLNCQVAGDSAGTVQSQSEAAGSSVQKGTVVTITCG
mgnify:CR=1 FL=1